MYDKEKKKRLNPSRIMLSKKNYLLSMPKTLDPAFVFLSVTSLENPIGNIPPSSLRTTVKWLSIPCFFHSEATMGLSI